LPTSSGAIFLLATPISLESTICWSFTQLGSPRYFGKQIPIILTTVTFGRCPRPLGGRQSIGSAIS
jgi:hypothetical protein